MRVSSRDAACSGVYLTYGIFTKKSTDYAELTLRTSKIGLQLPTRPT